MINIDKQKETLQEEKVNLENELSGMGSIKNEIGVWVARPEAETAPEADENDMASRGEDFELKSSTTEILAKRLSAIETAIANIESGIYGKCSVCGNDIEDDRLEANPSAQTCKACM